MKTPTREQWQAAHPALNPDYVTPFGFAWTLTARQEQALRERDNDDVRRDERRHGA